MSADDATIERAARAARNANYATGCKPGKDSEWDLGPGFEQTRDRYRRIARAVLAAADEGQPVTFAELHGEIARRDQQITDLTAALTGLLDTYDRGIWRGKTNWDTAWANARIALGLRQPDPDLDPQDLRVTTYDPPDATCIDSPGRGVTITHIPSGWGSSCHSERSQLQNKVRALDALKARVAVWRNTE